MTIFRQMNHISTMFTCADQQQEPLLNSSWCHCGHVRSLSWLPCRLLPNFICRTNRWGCSASRRLWFAEQSCISAGRECESLMGPVYRNTQTCTTLMQHDLTPPAACTLNHQSYQQQCFAVWIWVTKIILISNGVFMFSKPTQWSHRCLWSNPKMNQSRTSD